MKWWEYLMFWRWIGAWIKKTREERLKAAAIENNFQKLLDEAEERRGDLQDAVRVLRNDREQRQATSIRKPRLNMTSQTEPVSEGR